MSAPTATARWYVESNSVPTSTVAVTGAIGDGAATSRRHGPTLHGPKTTPTMAGGSPTEYSGRAPTTEHNRSRCAPTSSTGSVASTLRTVVGSRSRATQNDHLVLVRTVRIPLGQAAVLGEADPVGSGNRPEIRGLHPSFDSVKTQRRERILDYCARRLRLPKHPQVCALAFQAAHQVLAGIGDIGAQRRVPPTHYLRVSLNAACRPSASRFGSKGANDSRTVLSSTPSRLVAGIEAENGELACQGRELVRGPLSDQSRPLCEADTDRHLDCEAA